jgi:hypothetical protein
MLQQLQRELSQRAIDLFTEMRFDEDDYVQHFSKLGQTLKRIDSYTSSSTLINDLTKYEYDYLALCDDETVEDFLNDMFRAK